MAQPDQPVSRPLPPIVMYSATPWDAGWRPRREYASELSRRGWPVVYTTGAMSLWERNGDDWKRAPWFGSVQRADNLVVDRPGRLPCRWPGRRVDKAVLCWHGRRIAHASAGPRVAERIAMVFDPMFFPYVEYSKPRHVVYFQYEALSLLPGVSPDFHALEASLVDRADMVISLTRAMASVLPGSAPSTARILPSAVRERLFTDAADTTMPEELARIPTPRIGYVGSITMALNFDLALGVAKARPDWQLVFVGPIETDGGTGPLREPEQNRRWQALLALPNVHHLPQQPPETAARLMAHMDVNALWYRTSGDGWWVFNSPIKMYENLAVGKPVVGTSLDGVQGLRAVVALADTVDEWVAAIGQALAGNARGSASERRAVAHANSWDRRTDRLEQWLLEMIGDSAPVAPATPKTKPALSP